MRVRLLVEQQGFGVRSDGTYFEWPGRGNEIELDDATAIGMIRAEQAVPVSSFRSAETMVAEDPREEQRGMGHAGNLFARPGGAHATADEALKQIEAEEAVRRSVAAAGEPAPGFVEVEAKDEVNVSESASATVERAAPETDSEPDETTTQPRRGRPPKYTR